MLMPRPVLWTSLVVGWLALGMDSVGLHASRTGEPCERTLAEPADGDGSARLVQPTEEGKEAKGAGPSGGATAVRAGARPGKYQREGLRQEDKADRVLGMRGDRRPASKVLQWLEQSVETRAAAELARRQSKVGWYGKRPSQVEAARGFGAHVDFDSPLLKRIAADFQSGLWSGREPLFLDMGAGLGYNTDRLVKLGARVVANDQSYRQLAILRRFLLEDSLPKVHLNDGDILDKGFPDATFDGILASHVFHCLPPRALETLVPRLHRWLRPGGRLYIQCFNINGPFACFRPTEDFAESFGDDVHPIELGDLVRLLKASGFDITMGQVNDHPVYDPGSDHWSSMPASEVMVVAQAGKLVGPGPGTGLADAGENKNQDETTRNTKAEGESRSSGEAALRQILLNMVLPIRDGHAPAGSYRSEGQSQGEGPEAILGMRADRTPASQALRALEASEETRDAIGEACQAYSLSWRGKPQQVDAAPGFGSNVAYRSPLIQRLHSDIKSGRPSPLFLDVGAGIGYNTQGLVKLGARVVANDQSTGQLAILRGFLGDDTGYRPQVYLNDGSILDKGFPGGTFDGILASHLIHYLSPRALEALVPRFRHWLRPGGRLYIQCWNIEAGPFSWFRPIWEENRRAGKPWPGSIENAHQRAAEFMDESQLKDFREGFGDYLHAIQLEDLLKLLETSGFAVQACQESDFKCTDRFGGWGIVPACEIMVVAQAVSSGPGPVERGDSKGSAR